MSDLGAMAATARSGATAGSNNRSADDGPKLDPLDPQVVAGRLAYHLRRPKPKAETIPQQSEREPASAPARHIGRIEDAAGARVETFSRNRSPAGRPLGEVRGSSPVRGRPALQHAIAKSRQLSAQEIQAGDVSQDPDRIPPGLEAARRARSVDEALNEWPAARERSGGRRSMAAVSGLLLVGAVGGALVAYQWMSPRDRPITASVASTPAAVESGAEDTAFAARSALTAADPAPAVFAGTGPVTQPSATAAPARDAAANGTAPPAAATLAEVPAQTLTPRALTGTAAAPPLPSWYVEDDPIAHEAANLEGPRPAAGAAAGSPSARRMVATSDVDVRVAPDAKSESLGILKAGTVIQVGDCRLWCELTVNGRAGWVFYTFLSDPPLTAAVR